MRLRATGQAYAVSRWWALLKGLPPAATLAAVYAASRSVYIHTFNIVRTVVDNNSSAP